MCVFLVTRRRCSLLLCAATLEFDEGAVVEASAGTQHMYACVACTHSVKKSVSLSPRHLHGVSSNMLKSDKRSILNRFLVPCSHSVPNLVLFAGCAALIQDRAVAVNQRCQHNATSDDL